MYASLTKASAKQVRDATARRPPGKRMRLLDSLGEFQLGVHSGRFVSEWLALAPRTGTVQWWSMDANAECRSCADSRNAVLN